MNEPFRQLAINNDDCGSDEGFKGSFPLTQAVLLTKQVMRYTCSAADYKCVRNNGKTSKTNFRRKDETTMISKRNDKWTGRKFKVTVHLPDVVSESVRQSKIDRLYDILKAANAKNRSPENTGNDDENDSK